MDSKLDEIAEEDLFDLFSPSKLTFRESTLVCHTKYSRDW